MLNLTTYGYLAAAIVSEVVATTALAQSASFTRLWPSVVTIIGYALAFWFLSYPIAKLPTGVVYAIWSGLGIVLITLVAWIGFGERLDAPALVGLAFIVAGVLVVNLFSDSIRH